MAHCNSTDQLFGIATIISQNNPLDGILNYHQIYMNGTQPLFFNLYSCFSTNLMENNNIGTHYLFDGQALVIIGCSRSGG